MLRRIVANVGRLQKSKSLSTDARVIKSQFPDVNIPNLRVDEYIFKNIARWADKTALECLETGRSYTYHQLQKRSYALANFLRGPLRLEREDTIAVVLNNIPEYAVIVLGGSAAGLKVTTINPVYTQDEIKKQVMNSNAKLIFTLPELWSTVSGSVKSAGNIPIVVVKHKNDDGVPAGAISFEKICNSGQQFPLGTVDPKETFLLPYSSGTTGLPKGVELTHFSLVANFCQTLHPDVKLSVDTAANQQDVMPIFLPLFHLYGLGVVLFTMLSQGCKMVTFPKFGTEALLKFLEHHKPTLLHAVPPIVLAMTNNEAIKPRHLETIRTVTSGAAPLGAADVERFHKKTGGKVNLLQLYGLTEASPIITIQTPKAERGIKIGGSGFLIPNTECKVVSLDNTTTQSLGPNQSGELYFRGPQNMKGYYNNETATRETLDENGWLKTGDIGYYDEDGHFFITDRLKELIKVKGFQVAPAELEEVLRSHPEVADAAVVGVPHGFSGEAPKAFVVPKNKNAKAAEIEKYVNSKVADYKKLRGGVVFIEDIPKTASGKILRRHLKLM